MKNVIRIGHGNYTYLKKYGIYDYRGGGRASARETAARVAAGAVAKTLLGDIKIRAKIIEVGGEKEDFSTVLKKVMEEGDYVGGVIECVISNVPAGLGEPIIKKPMKTMTLDGQNTVVMQKTNVRTDPCVAIRAPAIVDAMSALVLADFILLDRTNLTNKL
ncbi:MAG: Chorismate synthase [Chlamydiia bacterium]|nr:Chorismate synthase [Chlamydiia bacterium]